jgi:hypothetical protein
MTTIEAASSSAAKASSLCLAPQHQTLGKRERELNRRHAFLI